jgi:hypothetical protein
VRQADNARTVLWRILRCGLWNPQFQLADLRDQTKDFLQHFLHQGLQGVRFVPEKGFHSSEMTAMLLSGHGVSPPKGWVACALQTTYTMTFFF